MPEKQRSLDSPNTTADKTAAKTTYGEGNTTSSLANRMLLDKCDSHRWMDAPEYKEEGNGACQ